MPRLASPRGNGTVTLPPATVPTPLKVLDALAEIARVEAVAHAASVEVGRIEASILDAEQADADKLARAVLDGTDEPEQTAPALQETLKRQLRLLEGVTKAARSARQDAEQAIDASRRAWDKQLGQHSERAERRTDAAIAELTRSHAELAAIRGTQAWLDSSTARDYSPAARTVRLPTQTDSLAPAQIFGLLEQIIREPAGMKAEREARRALNHPGQS